jgi:aldehyde dehydrogenase (NAD+)
MKIDDEIKVVRNSAVATTARIVRCWVRSMTEAHDKPWACFIKFRDEADAIRTANESQYGLGGGVWTKDLDRAFRVARGVRTGTMWVNTFLEVRSGTPFGGYKQSGYGREVHKAALQHYTQKKTIYLRLESD